MAWALIVSHLAALGVGALVAYLLYRRHTGVVTGEIRARVETWNREAGEAAHSMSDDEAWAKAKADVEEARKNLEKEGNP